jgi:hypothetical protein
LAAFAALCSPATVLLAQEDFTAESAARALSGFGDIVLRSNCFRNRQDVRPLRIAVTQMQKTIRFEDYEEEAITDRIEEALREDRQLTVLKRRERLQIDQMWRELGDSQTQGPDDKLEAIIRISEETGSVRRVKVEAYAPPLCAGPARSMVVGRIERSPDVPRKLFERAAGRLPERISERLVVMPPDISNYGNDVRAIVMARRLQQDLADAVNQVFQERAITSPADVRAPATQIYQDGMDVSGAWQGHLRLKPSPKGGIDVHVEFRTPGNQAGGRPENGYLAPDVFPADSDPAVLVEKEKRNQLASHPGQYRDQTAGFPGNPDTLKVRKRSDGSTRFRLSEIVNIERELPPKEHCERLGQRFRDQLRREGGENVRFWVRMRQGTIGYCQHIQNRWYVEDFDRYNQDALVLDFEN